MKDPVKTIKRRITGASLVVWWWGIHLPAQGTQISSLRQEDPTCCTAVLQGSNFCTSLPAVVSSFLSFYSSHSNRCEVVSCCGLFLFCLCGLSREACGILVPQPGTETGPSAVKAQSPSHKLTRGFPLTGFSTSLMASDAEHLFTCLLAPGLAMTSWVWQQKHRQ